MKKVILSISLLMVGSFCLAMEGILASDGITLPTSKIIQKRLYKAGFGKFVKKTHIHTNLASKTITSLGIELAVETHFHDYTPYNQKLTADILAQEKKQKQQIITILLADHPTAIAHLKARGALD